MSGAGGPVTLLEGFQPFPKLDSPMVDPQTGICGSAWQRFFMKLWIASGASKVAQPNGASVTQTAQQQGAPLAVIDNATGKQLGTIALVNQPGEPAVPQVVGASPAIFIANKDGFWVVSSGEVEVSRNGGATWQQASLTGGCFPIVNEDQLRVTYSQVAPTVVFYPSGSAG